MARKGEHDPTKSTVAYVPFATFCTALDYLKSHGMPSKIDASVSPTFAGDAISHLLLSLRALGLITGDGDPAPELANLADDTTRKQTLAKVLPKAYASLFQKVDISKASPSQLDAALQEQNVRGATARKARGVSYQSGTICGVAYKESFGKTNAGGGATKERWAKGQTTARKTTGISAASHTTTGELLQSDSVATGVRSFDTERRF